jgi:dUTP pyrophosphatase
MIFKRKEVEKASTETNGLLFNVPVKIEKVDPHAIIPTYAHSDDACCDLYIIEDYIIRKRQRRICRTGIAVEIPTGYEIQIRPRSGLALRQGISLVNAPGTIDAQYRNEIKLLVINLGQSPVSLRRGDRVAQMCIKPVYTMKFTEVDKLSESDRGLGGWGSTGE